MDTFETAVAQSNIPLPPPTDQSATIEQLRQDNQQLRNRLDLALTLARDLVISYGEECDGSIFSSHEVQSLIDIGMEPLNRTLTFKWNISGTIKVAVPHTTDSELAADYIAEALDAVATLEGTSIDPYGIDDVESFFVDDVEVAACR